MKVEEVLEGAGHPEGEEVVAFSLKMEFTGSLNLSTFSCICYQNSVLLCVLAFYYRYFLSKSCL